MTERAGGSIKVLSDYPFAFAEVLDANRQKVGFGTGSFEVTVTPGIYVVRANVAGSETEQLMRVPAGEDRLVTFPQLAPLPPLGALADVKRPLLTDAPPRGTESAVVVFTELDESGGLPQVELSDGWGRRLATVSRLAADGAIAWLRKPLRPGTYALEYIVPGLGPRRQPVYAAPNFETQVFVSYADGNCTAQIYIRPLGSGYDPATLDGYALTDAALDAFGQVTVLPAARDAARGAAGSADPLLRLLGAWGAFVMGDLGTARMACAALERTLPGCADVQALQFLLAKPGTNIDPIELPPLLAAVTQQLVARAADNARLVPGDSWLARIAPRLRGGSPWTRWDPTLTSDEVRTQVARALRTALRRSGGGERVGIPDLPKSVTDAVRIGKLEHVRADITRIGRSALWSNVLLWLRSRLRTSARSLGAWELNGRTRVRGAPPDPAELMRGGGQQAGEVSSRTDARDAGWPSALVTVRGQAVRLTESRSPWRDLSWLVTRALSHLLDAGTSKLLRDRVDARRHRWMSAQRDAGALELSPDLVIQLPDARSCMILGDLDEGDGTADDVIEPLRAVDRQLQSEFIVALGGAIDPAGTIANHLHDAAGLSQRKPILAIPGARAWQDGLTGFMLRHCDSDALEHPSLAERKQQPESAFSEDTIASAPQPGPYWAVDMAGGLRLIALDTGVSGEIDREQGEWLLRVSKGGGPKVLLTAASLYVDGKPHTVPINWGPSGSPAPGLENLDDVVRCQDRGFVAAIASGVGNYQRLTMSAADRDHGAESSLEYVTAGGTGAPISATHHIARATPAGSATRESAEAPDTTRLRCYPTRGDSLAYFALRPARRVFTLSWVSLVVLALSLCALAAWTLGFPGRLAHGVLPIAAASIIGFVGIPALVTIAFWLARKSFPSAFRKLGAAFVLPWLIGPSALVLASALGKDWDWFWRATLIGLGASASAIAIGLGWLWLLLGGIPWQHDRFLAQVPVIARPHLWLRLTALTLSLATPLTVLVTLLDAWATEVVVAGFLVSTSVVCGLFVVIVVTGGRRAFREDVAGRGVDADMALSYLHWLGVVETLPRNDDPSRLARVGDFDYRTARICDLMLPGVRGPRAWVNAWIRAMATVEMPPTFRSFVSLSIEDGALVLACHGVTGWAEHATTVPREDCVRISLRSTSPEPSGNTNEVTS